MTKRLRRLIFAVFFSSQSLLCFGSHIKTISSSDGLSNNAIYALHQDRYGHIWIGTGDGVNIWNGRTLENFQFKESQNYFFGNQVRNIIPSQGDKILIQTKYGVAELNTLTKSIKFHEGLALHSKIAVTTTGNIISLNKDHIEYYDTETESFIEFKDFKLCKDEKCVYMNLIQDKYLYIYTDNGSYLVTLDLSNPSTPTISETKNLKLECLYVSPQTYMTNEHYIITKDRALYTFNITSREIAKVASISDSWINENRITGIVNTSDVFYISFIEKGVYTLPKGESKLKPSDIDYGIFSMLKDRNQPIIWIGTDCNGLQLYNETTSEIWSTTFENLPYSINMPVRSILIDKNKNLWFGTKGDGLYRIQNFKAQVEFSSKNTTKFAHNNSSLAHNSVYALTESKSDIIWIGTDGKGLNYYSYLENKVNKVAGSEKLRQVHCILEKGNTLWISTDSRGSFKCKYEIQEGIPVIVSTDTLHFCEPFNHKTSIFAISEQNDSTLWFASRSHGVLCYNVNTEKSRVIKFPTNYGLGINEVTDIASGKDMLFATGNGLVIFNPETDSLTVSPDVPYRTIHSVSKDRNGNIWLSTNQGIISLDSNYNYRTSYNRFSRLKVLEYSDGAVYDDGDRMFFGGINGITIIQTDSSIIEGRNTPYRPPINITDFIQNNSASYIESKLENGKLYIPSSKQNFAIKYSIVDNINTSDYIVKYNLKKHDDIWRDCSSEMIYIPTLAPGDYVLQIKYINKATHYESQVCELPICIIPPIYKSSYAKIIYVLLLVCCIIFIIKRFKDKQRATIEAYKKRYAEEVQNTKVETVNSISEELSMLITFILGLSTQLKQRIGNNSILKEKLNLMDYNIFKINNVLNILKDTKDLSDEIESPREMQFLPISQLTKNLLEILKVNVKSKKAQLLHDIDDDIILRINKDYYQTLFNSLIHKSLSIISGKREIYVNLKRDLKESGILLIIKVSAEEKDSIALISDKTETHLHSTLVEKMNGYIGYGYENGEVIVTLMLPQHKSIHEINIEDQLPTEFETNPGKEYIFLISTNKEISSFIGYFLLEKYNIRHFQDNESAFEAMESKMPATVIYDYSSLRRGFSEYIEQIKSNKRSRHISVIALTSSLQLNERKECTRMGADLCISFPFNVEYLQAVLEKMIDKRENIAEYFNSPLSVYEKKDGKLIHKEDKAFYQKVLDIIHNNISNPELSAPMIAKELGLSLRVMYRKLEGIDSPNLNQIVIETRMKIAMKYLTCSKMTINEIIFKVGYENRSTFYRNFKNSYGMTPKEYREQIQNKTLEEFN